MSPTSGLLRLGLAPAALRSGGDLFTRLLKGGRGCGGISSNGWGKREGFRWARIASLPSPGKFAHDYFQEGTLFSHSWSGRSGEENLTNSLASSECALRHSRRLRGPAEVRVGPLWCRPLRKTSFQRLSAGESAIPHLSQLCERTGRAQWVRHELETVQGTSE